MSDNIHDLAQESLKRLAQIMREGEDRDSIRASEVLIDKAIKLPKNEPQRKQLAQMSDAELMAVINGPTTSSLADSGDPLLK